MAHSDRSMGGGGGGAGHRVDWLHWAVRLRDTVLRSLNHSIVCGLRQDWWFCLGAFRPDATFRQHGARTDLDDNVSVAVTTNFLREIAAGIGAQPVSQSVVPWLVEQLAHPLRLMRRLATRFVGRIPATPPSLAR